MKYNFIPPKNSNVLHFVRKDHLKNYIQGNLLKGGEKVKSYGNIYSRFR